MYTPVCFFDVFSILSQVIIRGVVSLYVFFTSVEMDINMKVLPEGVSYSEGLYAVEISSCSGLETKYYKDPLIAFTTKRRADRKEAIRQDKRLAMQMVND